MIALLLAAELLQLVTSTPSPAKSGWGSDSPPATHPIKPTGPSGISSIVSYKHSYTGAGTPMTSSATGWTPPVCWYEPAFSATGFSDYITSNYTSSHSAFADMAAKYGKNDYHKADKGAWWALQFSDDRLAGQCAAMEPWVWISPTKPPPPTIPIIDPHTLAGLAYNDTTLPAPPLTLHPVAENQLVNLDTQLTFNAPLNRVWVTAQLDNAAAGVHIAATTVAEPAQLQVDAGTGNANPRSCTYNLTHNGNAYNVDTSKDPCNITYLKQSPPGGYTLQATLIWNVTWTPSANPDGPPQTPPFPPGQSTTPVQVTVHENQTITH